MGFKYSVWNFKLDPEQRNIQTFDTLASGIEMYKDQGSPLTNSGLWENLQKPVNFAYLETYLTKYDFDSDPWPLRKDIIVIKSKKPTALTAVSVHTGEVISVDTVGELSRRLNMSRATIDSKIHSRRYTLHSGWVIRPTDVTIAWVELLKRWVHEYKVFKYTIRDKTYYMVPINKLAIRFNVSSQTIRSLYARGSIALGLQVPIERITLDNYQPDILKIFKQLDLN